MDGEPGPETVHAAESSALAFLVAGESGHVGSARGFGRGVKAPAEPMSANPVRMAA